MSLSTLSSVGFISTWFGVWFDIFILTNNFFICDVCVSCSFALPYIKFDRIVTGKELNVWFKIYNLH